MASMAMSNSVAAKGRGAKVVGRKGGRCRQMRTEVERSGEKSLVQRVWSSTKIRRVMRLRWP